MTAYVVSREDNFDFRSSEYVALYEKSQATHFQHPVWLRNLYDVLARRRKAQKQVVTVRAEDGRIVLVLPFVRRRLGLLRLIEYADLGVNDHAAPVLDPDATASLAADRQVSKRFRRMLGRFDLLMIERVADSPDLMLSLIAGATAKRHAYNTHLVELPENAEAWRAQLDPKFSLHLERAYKRLRPKGERRLRIIDDVAEVDSVMERMQTFREARFAEHRGTDLVQDPDCFGFYSAVALSSPRTGSPDRGSRTPATPLLVDISGARPAGAVVCRDGRLLRPVQDNRTGYGAALLLTEITRLDSGAFAQQPLAGLGPSPHWPGRRLHTLNRAGRLEVVDGSAMSPPFRITRRRAGST